MLLHYCIDGTQSMASTMAEQWKQRRASMCGGRKRKTSKANRSKSNFVRQKHKVKTLTFHPMLAAAAFSAKVANFGRTCRCRAAAVNRTKMNSEQQCSC